MPPYRDEPGAKPSPAPLAWIWLAMTIAVVAYRGLRAYPEGYLTLSLPFRYPGRFGLDPLLGEVLAKVAPLPFALFGAVYDVPLTHLIGGLVCASAVCAAFLYYAWTLTRSPLACLLSVLFLFGLTRWDGVIGARFPVGPMDAELWEGLYLSPRQLGMACLLGSAGLLHGGRALAAGLLLGAGTHVHALNCMAAFLCFSLGLGLWCLAQAARDRRAALRVGLSFAGGFLLLALPRILGGTGLLREVVPISGPEFWRFCLHNEPDDMSVLYLFNSERGPHTRRELAVCLAMLAAALVPAVRSRLSPRFLEERMPGARPLLPFLLAAPLLVTGLALLWETAFVARLPDFVNDFLIPLQFRRYMSLSMIPASPVAAVILVGGWQALSARLFKRPWPRESTLAIGLAALAAAAYLVIGRSNLRQLPAYLSTEHKRFDYFLRLHSPGELDRPAWETLPSDRPEIPIPAIIEACDWVRANTPPSAAFISPAYLRQFRGHCERAAFVTEKHDSGVALTNRRYATVFLRRFRDLHRMDFMDLPGPVQGGAPYAVMRRQYLSLKAEDIEKLKAAYPGFSFLLTETTHRLPYPLLYKNAYLAVYDLRGYSAKTRLQPVKLNFQSSSMRPSAVIARRSSVSRSGGA